MKNKFIAAVLLLFARRSQLTAFSILRFVIPDSRLPSPSRFLIPDSRFGFLRAIPVLLALLTVAIVSPLHAATPGFDTLVNYDSAWTYVYDGGRLITGQKLSITDNYYDVKVLSDGSSICIGGTTDSTNWKWILLTKLDSSGKLAWKKRYEKSGSGHSIILAKNNDFIIGGEISLAPMVLRLDASGNMKWAAWYYDSVNSRNLLTRSATINSIRETKRGTIICAGGDYFTDQNYLIGNINYNFAAVLMLDSTGKNVRGGELNNTSGYNIGGFCIEETSNGNYIVSGNQAINYFDTSGNTIWQKKYTFMLNGVGSEVNNITRCKTLRDGTLIVAGQAYEGNCWTNFKHLYYDAWWSPISLTSGLNSAWDTAGFQGGDDAIYDFTQLNNGNIVFIGSRYSGPGGIWTFVTDSTGKHVLWEKQTPVPYKSDAGKSARAYSVCATDDGGFTVAGELILTDSLGGHNAMAAHFIPKPVSAVMSHGNSSLKSMNGFGVRFAGAKLLVSNTMSKIPATVSLFDISGRCVATQTGSEKISVNMANMARGTYVVRVKAGEVQRTIKFVIDR
jgi:hypothetical protein